MKHSHLRWNKVTPPKLTRVIERTRLFQQVDQARERSVVWVQAPAGMGKTTLAASYLRARKLKAFWYQVDEGDKDPATLFHFLQLAIQQAAPRYRRPLPQLSPDYLSALPVFTRRFFELLYVRLKPPTLLVFDNFQELPASDPIHHLLQIGLEVIPEGLTIMVLSREPPPPPLARLQANQRLVQFQENLLRLTLDETREIVRLHSHTQKWKPDTDLVKQFQEKTQGWVAALVLYLEQANVFQKAIPPVQDLTPQVVFDYLAVEVLSSLGKETLNFLLKTAFLPSMNVTMAEKITGNSKAEKILEYLYHGRYFTERREGKDCTYQYHPLFQECLQEQVKKRHERAEIVRRQTSSAIVLEEVGRVEEAFGLLQKTGNISEQIRMICAHAPRLLEQGRFQTLEEWLQGIPRDVVVGNPWLLVWLGNARMPMAPPESEEYFQAAYKQFKKRNEQMGMLVSWCGAVEANLLMLENFLVFDDWIDELNELLKCGLKFPSKELEARVVLDMFGAMVYRRAHDSEMKLWEERAIDCFPNLPGPHQKILAGYKLVQWMGTRGDCRKCAEIEALFRQVMKQHHPLDENTTIALNVTEAMLALGRGDLTKNLLLVEQGLDEAEKNGFTMWTWLCLMGGTIAALSLGKIDLAERYLERLRPMCGRHKGHIGHFYHGLRVWDHLLKGDFSLVRPQIEAMKVMSRTYGGNNFPKLQQLVLEIMWLMKTDGDLQTIRNLIQNVRKIAQSFDCFSMNFLCFLFEAKMAFDQGQETQGQTALRSAFGLARERGMVNTLNWDSQMMVALCAKALAYGIEEDYVRHIIRQNHLIPQDPMQVSDTWPWPVKIMTLGGFALHTNGQPVKFSRKMQRRPLDLLKALIGLGGQEVSELQLSDILWPDAEGDAAHQAWATTLHRLRELLGHPHAILRHESKLSLNAEVCWVDVFAFETLVNTFLGSPKPVQKDQERRQKALRIYQGSFLKGEEDPWIYPYRERLRSQYIRQVGYMANQYEVEGQGKMAIESVEEAVQKEPLVESLYQHLMQLLQREGYAAQVPTVYDQCRAMLKTHLGVEPSSQTSQLLQTLRSS